MLDIDEFKKLFELLELDFVSNSQKASASGFRPMLAHHHPPFATSFIYVCSACSRHAAPYHHHLHPSLVTHYTVHDAFCTITMTTTVRFPSLQDQLFAYCDVDCSGTISEKEFTDGWDTLKQSFLEHAADTVGLSQVRAS